MWTYGSACGFKSTSSHWSPKTLWNKYLQMHQDKSVDPWRPHPGVQAWMFCVSLWMDWICSVLSHRVLIRSVSEEFRGQIQFFSPQDIPRWLAQLVEFKHLCTRSYQVPPGPTRSSVLAHTHEGSETRFSIHQMFVFPLLPWSLLPVAVFLPVATQQSR